MKALYCARMVCLDICYTINSLSKYVTKWTALCDKQLRHLYLYLKSTAHIKLHGQVDSLDIDNVVLHAYPDADLCGTFDTTRATSGGFVELIGFVIPMISLAVRLFANLCAGHVLLKVLFGFCWTMMMAGGILFIAHFIPLSILFLLLGLETAVALIQA